MRLITLQEANAITGAQETIGPLLGVGLVSGGLVGASLGCVLKVQLFPCQSSLCTQLWLVSAMFGSILGGILGHLGDQMEDWGF